MLRYFWAICSVLGNVEFTSIHHVPVILSENQIIQFVGISQIYVLVKHKISYKNEIQNRNDLLNRYIIFEI